jgi:hypothetical protein
MDGSGDLRALASMLERAYRLALDVQDVMPSTTPGSRQKAVELVDVLDDARVSLLRASRSFHAADLLHSTPQRTGDDWA